jgi:hypothetical protein
MLSFLGALAVAGLVGAGILWVSQNITLRNWSNHDPDDPADKGEM